MIIVRYIQRQLLGLLEAMGLLTSVCVLAFVLMLAISYLSVGGVLRSESRDLATLTGTQQRLTTQVIKNALAVQLAVQNETWDTLEPVLSTLTNDHERWKESYEQLTTHPERLVGPAQEIESLSNLMGRLEYPFSKIKEATNELETVTKSVIRRAPYIDSKSQDRIAASVRLLERQEGGFVSLLGQIEEIYSQDARIESSSAVSTLRSLHLLMFGSFVLLVFIGITPRLQKLAVQAKSLRQDINKVHKQSNDRWRYLSSLGHEFRTPMNSIIGFASLLTHEDQDPETKIEHAGSILDAGNRLMGLIEDILDMSALEANELQTNTSQTDLRAILTDIQSKYQALASRKGLEFRTNFDDSCPASITTDPHRFGQIVSKIIDNAIEFTSKGSVEVHAALETVHQKEMLVVRVVDTGIGIDPKDMSRVFDPFEHAETGLNREHDGAGLGLTLARSLARQLGGDITIDSAIGAGSFVSILIDPGSYIPFCTETAQAEPVNHHEQIDLAVLESKLILIVEDGQDNQRLLSHHLTKVGCRIQLADNGQIGIDRVLAAIESGHPFDLILMDMQMPILDGFEATAILRENGITTPIIGVTAHSSDDDRTRFLNAGVDDYLAKPVQRTTLLQTCARRVSGSDQQPAQAA